MDLAVEYDNGVPTPLLPRDALVQCGDRATGPVFQLNVRVLYCRTRVVICLDVDIQISYRLNVVFVERKLRAATTLITVHY